MIKEKTDLNNLLSKIPGYQLKKSKNRAGLDIYFEGEFVARLFKKYEFYQFLEENKINCKGIITERLIPKISVFNANLNKIFILDIKNLSSQRYIYEKLQTSDFKRKQYQKLVSPLGLFVEYVYVLSDWFKKPEYKDVLDYIQSVHCHYKFNEIPLS